MKHVYKLRWITFIGLSAGFLLFLSFALFLSASIGNVRETNVPKKDTAPSALKWRIERIRRTHTDLTVSGWAAYPGRCNKIYNIHLLLKDRKSGRYYRMPTTMSPSESDKRRHSASNHHAGGGFWSHARIRQLKQPLSRYELYIQYYSDNKRIIAGTHLTADGLEIGGAR